MNSPFKFLYNTNTEPFHKAILDNPELWDSMPGRRISVPGIMDSPHREAPDIWLRYNPYDRLQSNPATFNDEHIPVWYPPYYTVKEQIDPLIFELMWRVRGEIIGCVLITKVPAGKKVYPHFDLGWHVDFYDKFYIQLSGAEGCVFSSEAKDGTISTNTPLAGQVHLFDNRMKHWVNNDSDVDRITLIVCVRTQMFGRK